MRLCLLVRGSRKGWKIRFVAWLLFVGARRSSFLASGTPNCWSNTEEPPVAGNLLRRAGFSGRPDLNGGYHG